MGLIIRIINWIVSLLTLLVFLYALLSFFLDRYNPVMEVLRKVVEPMLAPIRKHIPPVNGLDLSPLILIILLQIAGAILTAIVRSIFLI